MPVTRKAARQLLTQRMVLDKITREELAFDTPQVRASLATTRDHVTGMDRWIDFWEQLLDHADIDELRSTVLADTEAAAELRNLSPLTVLLTQAELDEIRDRLARERLSA